LVENVMQAFKKARATVAEDTRRCRKRLASDDSSSEEEHLEDARQRKRRMREKVAMKVSRVLDNFSGTDGLQGALLEARVAEAVEERVDELENEIRPELHKLEAKHRTGDTDGPTTTGQEQQVLALSVKCEEAEASLQTTRNMLEEETKKKREALDRAFHENQEKIQEKNEKERYRELWLDAERRANAAEARVACFMRPPEASSFVGSFVY
jgi:hypothetical protein